MTTYAIERNFLNILVSASKTWTNRSGAQEEYAQNLRKLTNFCLCVVVRNLFYSKMSVYQHNFLCFVYGQFKCIVTAGAFHCHLRQNSDVGQWHLYTVVQQLGVQGVKAHPFRQNLKRLGKKASTLFNNILLMHINLMPSSAGTLKVTLKIKTIRKSSFIMYIYLMFSMKLSFIHLMTGKYNFFDFYIRESSRLQGTYFVIV